VTGGREKEGGSGVNEWDRERRSLQYIAIAYSYLFVYSGSTGYVYIMRNDSTKIRRYERYESTKASQCSLLLDD